MAAQEVRFQGRCVEWHRGAGVVRPCPGQSLISPVFAHQTEVERPGLRHLQPGEAVAFSLGRSPAGRVAAQRLTDPEGRPLPAIEMLAAVDVPVEESKQLKPLAGTKRRKGTAEGDQSLAADEAGSPSCPVPPGLDDELPWLVLSTAALSSEDTAMSGPGPDDIQEEWSHSARCGADPAAAGGEQCLSQETPAAGDDPVTAALRRMLEGFRGHLQRWLANQRLRNHLQQSLIQGELQQLRPRLRAVLEAHAGLLSPAPAAAPLDVRSEVSLLNALAELHRSVKRDLVISVATLRAAALPGGSRPPHQHGHHQQPQQQPPLPQAANQAKRPKLSAFASSSDSASSGPPEVPLAQSPVDILTEILRRCPAGLKTNDLAKLYQQRTGESFAKTGQKLNHVLTETPSKFQKVGKLWKAAP